MLPLYLLTNRICLHSHQLERVTAAHQLAWFLWYVAFWQRLLCQCISLAWVHQGVIASNYLENTAHSRVWHPLPVS